MEPDDSRRGLSVKDLEYAHQILDKFELDVQNGVARPIEDVVAGLAATLRDYVILGCTRIEIEYSKSVSPEQWEAYRQRFPQIREELEKEFAAWPDRMERDGEEAETDSPRPQGAPPQIDGYELLEVLGAGSFGIVYRARSLQTGSDTAIKIIRPTNSLAEQENESDIHGKLDHPGIVKLLAVTRTKSNELALVQEYIPGRNLRQYLDSQPGGLPWPEAVQIISAIVEALIHVHQQGAFHLDLKPANILLREQDGQRQPVIADFGLAMRRRDRGNDKFSIIGTPRYLSPEQFCHDTWLPHFPGARSDLYSVGVILFQLLTNTHPFPMPDSHDRRESPPDPPRTNCPELPAQLSDICMRCLEFNPDDRYSSATDLLEALHALTAPKISDETPPDVLSLQALTQRNAGYYRDLVNAIGGEGLGPQIDTFLARILRQKPDEVVLPLPPIIALSAPSGAGKSSWVAAGMLPTLRERDHSNSFIIVHLNADESRSPHGPVTERTVQKLRSLLIYRLGLIPDTTDSLDTILQTWKRRASASRIQRSKRHSKLLIVLDQFEQWLSVHGHAAGSLLEQALANCDGDTLQVLLVFRSDARFTDAAMELMDRCGATYTDRSNGFRLRPLNGTTAEATLRHLLNVGNVRPAEQPAATWQDILQHSRKLLEAEQQGSILPVWTVLMARFIARHADKPHEILKRESFSEIAQCHIEEIFAEMDGLIDSAVQRREFREIRNSILARLLTLEADREQTAEIVEASQLTQISELATGSPPAKVSRVIEMLLHHDLLTLLHQRSDDGSMQAVCKLTHEFLHRPLRLVLQKLPEGRAERLYREFRDAWWRDPSPRNLPGIKQYIEILRRVPRDRRADSSGIRMLRAARRQLTVRAILAVLPSLLAIVGLSFLAALLAMSSVTMEGRIPTREAVSYAGLLAPVSEYVSGHLLADTSSNYTPRQQWAKWIAGLSWSSPGDFQGDNLLPISRMVAAFSTLPDDLRSQFLEQAWPHQQAFNIAAKSRVAALLSATPQKNSDEEAAVLQDSNNLLQAGELLALRLFLGADSGTLESMFASQPETSLWVTFTRAVASWMPQQLISAHIDRRSLIKSQLTLVAVLNAVDGKPLADDAKWFRELAMECRDSARSGAVCSAAQYALLQLTKESSKHNQTSFASTDELPPAWKLAPSFTVPGNIPFVKAADGLFVSVTEITEQQFMAICPENDRFPKHRQTPATTLTKEEICEFLNALNRQAGFNPAFSRNADQWQLLTVTQGFRLPRKTEFDIFGWAGRAETKPLGSRLHRKLAEDEWRRYARFYGEDGQSVSNSVLPVRSRRCNPLGLHDTFGNVAEAMIETIQEGDGPPFDGLAFGGGDFNYPVDHFDMVNAGLFPYRDPQRNDPYDNIGFRIVFVETPSTNP